MAKKEKSLMRQLIGGRGIKDVAGVQALVKELTDGLIQECMDAELEDDLGYSKYDYRNKETDNSLNGTYKKTVSSSQGGNELEVPRDRNGEYEPQIVKKHQMDISAIEDKIIFLYSQARLHGTSRNLDDADQSLGSNPDAPDDLLRRSSQRDALRNNTVLVHVKARFALLLDTYFSTALR